MAEISNKECFTKHKLLGDIISALKLVYKYDIDLIRSNVNERCVVSRVFHYIAKRTENDADYTGLVWDAEYNRVGLQGEAKKMGDVKASWSHIIPDLVLHHRGDDYRNVLVCEFKKNRYAKADVRKLAYMTGIAYQYKYGLQIVLRENEVDLVWLRDGCEEPYSFETYSTATWEEKSPFPDSLAPVGRRSCTLMVTRSCNLNCRYCFEPYKCNDKSKEMGFEMARSLILKEEQIVKDNPEYTELAIDFMGGEPLMNFPLIKRVVEWLERNPLQVPFICIATTNGTLVKRHESWLRKHSHILKLGGSYDGTPTMQRINRGTGDRFEDNIDLLHSIYPDLGFHMVISRESLPNLAEGVLSIQRKGYKVKAALAQGVSWNASDVKIFGRELKKLARAYLGVDKSLPPINLLTRMLMNVSKDPSTYRQEKWCGSGTNMITYDYDGKSYGCHMFTPVVLGERSIEAANLNYTCRDSVEDDRCKECIVKSVCPTCAGFNFRYRGSLAKRDLSWCDMVKTQMRIACAFQIKKLARSKHMSFYEKQIARSAYKAYPVFYP